MKVSQHLIQAPASDQLDAVSVNKGAEEGHGTCGSEVAGGYIAGFESVGRSKEHDDGL